MNMQTITKENFQSEVLSADKPVLVDFWAPWCGYCRRLSPVMDQLAAELKDVQIGTINIDEQPELAKQFRVETIPTLLLFQNGKAGEPLIAPEAKADIKDWMAQSGI